MTDNNIRADPYLILRYYINRQAIKDLANMKSRDNAQFLTAYLMNNYIDNEYQMQRIITLALTRRFYKLLLKIARELDKMEEKVNNMRMTLDDLFNDMEQAAADVKVLNALNNTTNEADKIEAELDAQNENEDADEDENDEIIPEEKEEIKED